MEIVSNTAFALNCFFDYLGLAVQHAVNANNCWVSLLIDFLIILKNVVFSVASCVYIVLRCCLLDFVTFLEDLGLLIKFSAHLVIMAIDNILLMIWSLTCDFGCLIYSLFSFICQVLYIIFVLGNELIEMIRNFFSILALSMVLMLRMAALVFIVPLESFGHFASWMSDSFEEVFYRIMTSLIYSPQLMVDTILNIPLDTYIGFIVVITTFYFRYYIYKIVTFWFLQCRWIFSILANFVIAELIPYIHNSIRLYIFTACCFVHDTSPFVRGIYEFLKILFLLVLFRPLPRRLTVLSTIRSYTLFSREYNAFRNSVVSYLFKKTVPSEETEGLPQEVQTLQIQLLKEIDKRLCVVCQDRERSLILLPCNHFCLCHQCLNALRRYFSGCPLCRRFILDTITVFS